MKETGRGCGRGCARWKLRLGRSMTRIVDRRTVRPLSVCLCVRARARACLCVRVRVSLSVRVCVCARMYRLSIWASRWHKH